MESSDRSVLSVTHTGHTSLLRVRLEGGAESFRILREEYGPIGVPAAGEPLDADTLAELADAAERCAAVLRAERILAAGDNTRRRLWQKLLQRGVPRASADFAVRYMHEHGYIREDEFAYRTAVLCAQRKLWGRGKICAHLLSKGIGRADAEAAIDRAEGDGEIDFAESFRTLAEKKLGEDQTPDSLRALRYRYGYR